MYQVRGVLYILFLAAFFVAVFPQKAYAQIFFPFEGEVDFNQHTLQARLDLGERGLVSLSLIQRSPTKLDYTVNLDQFKLPMLLVSTMLEGDITLQNNANGELIYIGRVKSRFSLINDKPVEELAGRFVIRDKTMILESVSVGNVICSGRIVLDNPIKTDLVFRLTDVELQDFIAFWYGGTIIPSTGLVNGVIEAKGDIDHLNLKGQLTSTSGNVKDLQFDSMHYTAEGVYPVITLFDSYITETEGRIFEVQGMLDLSDAKNFRKQILALNKMPIVSDSEFKSEWTLKRLTDEEHSTSSELKYMRKKPSALDYANDDSDAVIGFERKVQF